MMQSCNCLNIVIEVEKGGEIINKELLELSDDENIFDEGQWYIGKLSNIQKIHPGLITTKHVGLWTITKCLNCDMHTHAIHKKKGANYVLVYSKLLKREAINNIKSTDLVSSIFNVVVNPNALDLEGPAINNYSNRNVEKSVKDLNDVVSNFIRREQAAIDERIRKYSDEQFELLNALKDRAYKERETLVKIVQNAAKTSDFDLSPKSPKLFGNVSSNRHSNTSDIPFSPKRPKSTSADKSKQTNQKDDESDMMFTFESEDFSAMKSSFHERNFEDSESEEIEEAEDVVNTVLGIDISRDRSGSTPTVAKSCPVDIPIFSQPVKIKSSRSGVADGGHGSSPQEKEEFDIAASIKALAKSVHGDAIFGELPRPKFSTQI
ncbi:uncharacterized protein PRAS40 [Euwallacea fornicatus]|uniref:uncharacterized protein PRAS40 n=1 Tax=Euwallacea fornicatus TaxID=995702 RepID=UPI0033905BA9